MIIRFKTREPFFSKEEDGYKCNTVRQLDQDDVRFDDLMFLLQADDYGSLKAEIEIFNPENSMTFHRTITDVTYFDERFVISWRHKK